MKSTQKIKKFVTITLAAAMILLNNNSFTVHAQDISQVTVYKPGYGMVSTDSGSGVNVRNAPNLTTSEIIKSLPNETWVMIVGQSGDFYKVQYDTPLYKFFNKKSIVQDFLMYNEFATTITKESDPVR